MKKRRKGIRIYFLFFYNVKLIIQKSICQSKKFRIRFFIRRFNCLIIYIYISMRLFCIIKTTKKYIYIYIVSQIIQKKENESESR